MRVVQLRDTGSAIRLLQTCLRDKGFRPGPIDSQFGDDTLRAVCQFQSAHNLEVDGIVGDKTWALLTAVTVFVPPADIVEERYSSLVEQIPVATVGEPRNVLLAACDTLGWREEPDGSNTGPKLKVMVDGYYSQASIDEHGRPPWCALAVGYWLREGLNVSRYSDTPFESRFGAASQIEDWGVQNGCFTPAKGNPTVAPGSVFVMGRAGSGSDLSKGITDGHTGLVIRDLGDAVLTIEGNTANQVLSRNRLKNTLRGFVKWWA